jgi:hypothetical protein
MGLREHVPWVPLAGLVLVALPGVAVVGLLDLLAVLGGGWTNGSQLLVSLVAAAVPYLAVGLVLALVGLGLLVWVLVSVLRTASEELDGGPVEDIAGYVERKTGVLSRFGVASRLGPGSTTAGDSGPP